MPAKMWSPKFYLPEPLWCLDRLTLHSFVPELCVNLKPWKGGHRQARAVGAETVCANPTPRANIETAAPLPAEETRWPGPERLKVKPQ